MPVAVAFGDIVLVQLYSRVAEQVGVTSFNYRVSFAGAPAATDADIADHMGTLLASSFKALIENRGTFDGTLVRITNQLPLPSAQISTNGSGAGTGGTDGLPRQSCGLISWRTGFAGPGKRGRTYTPFPPTDANETGGSITTAFQLDMETFADNVFGPINVSSGGRTATLVLCVRSVKHGTSADVTEHVIGNKWATQRRRGSFGRANSGPFG